jgi:hypothetical protein
MHTWAPQPGFRCQRTGYRALACCFTLRPRQAFGLPNLPKRRDTSQPLPRRECCHWHISGRSRS